MQKIAAVIGTTGVGKSQLGVELCKALRGQVINADSMQVYKGLDIISNKMPAIERQGVPHHLMDFLDPEKEYNVTDFERDAALCIDKLTSEQQLPVVVGGTNYYIQSLIWQNTLSKSESPRRSPSPERYSEFDNVLTSELYAQLCKVDPVMANKWNPSDRRKIIRSLKIFHDTGKPQGEIIKEQQEQLKRHGLPAKYKSLIFWLYADPVKLNPRLDERVDKMIETGLFDEIQELRKRVVDGSVRLPGQDLEKYQRGLWQAIGYKEFDSYFTALEANNSTSSDLDKIRQECTERMKAATRRYAKRQVQWIRNKLLPTVRNSNGDVQVYLLDATNLDVWDSSVRDKAIEIATAFQSNDTMPAPVELSEVAASMLSVPPDAQDTHSRVLNWKKYTCPICRTEKGEEAVLNGEMEWQQHLKSRWHRKSTKHQKLVKERLRPLQEGSTPSAS
ncbi:IPP transferase-domain-containing protein [Radiomyces spectabilis]|uniref:IPP transferase-domain-containing protein n=1 Tax=Radiomyces spectabilis TaxID=64574 RepID=UPI00221F3A0F|nr:IPP transferase-domain-containing protein [Radiomyces spectabilis]KAI8373023.1 IPP transferase-domain-containing protein [Radiomyces spectabilis]